MGKGQSNGFLLGTINRIERSLARLTPADESEIRLCISIEEAVEIGYEAVYRRPENKRWLAEVLPFRAIPS